MKNIYQKTYDRTYENYAYVWRQMVICPHCKRGLIEEQRPWEDISFNDPLLDTISDEKDWKGIEPRYKCPKCGYEFGTYSGCDIDKQKSDVPLYYLRYYSSDELLSESIHYDNDRKRLILFMSYISLTPTQNGLISKQFFEKWIVDIKRHTSYCYTPQSKSRKIVNTTNCFGFSTPCCFETLMRSSNNAWAKMLKYTCAAKGLSQIYKEVLNSINHSAACRNSSGEWVMNHRDFVEHVFHIINCLNRIPNVLVCYDSYKEKYKYRQNFNEMLEEHILSNFAKNSPHNIMDYQTYLYEMIDKCKLPKTKAFWKLYLEKPQVMNEIMFFQKCGFKNNDNMLSLINGGKFYMFNYQYCGNKANEIRLRTVSQIIKKMLKVTPENQVVKKINSLEEYNRYEFEDMLRMYEDLKRVKKEYLKMIDWHGTLMDIHDDLSKLTTKLQYENQEIPYDKEDYDLVEQIGDFSFNLANDTNQLVEIGQKMGICVGGYRSVALSGTSKIIHVKQNDKYVGCIELSKSHSLRQAKAKYNNMMTGELAEALKKWVVKKKIQNPEDCSDYRRLGEELNSHHDYHQYEIDEEGNVFTPAPRRPQIIEPQMGRHVEDEEGWYDEMPFL